MKRGFITTHRADGSAPSPHSLKLPDVLGPKPTTVRGIALGKDTIFDLTWQDWYDFDEGHAALWLASKQSESEIRERFGDLAGSMNARIFPLDELPYGITPPAGTTTVWAVYLMSADPERGKLPCNPCSGDAMPQFYVGGCTCLPLKSVKTRPPLKFE